MYFNLSFQHHARGAMSTAGLATYPNHGLSIQQLLLSNRPGLPTPSPRRPTHNLVDNQHPSQPTSKSKIPSPNLNHPLRNRMPNRPQSHPQQQPAVHHGPQRYLLRDSARRQLVSAVHGDMLRANPGPPGQRAVHRKGPGDGPYQAQHV
jgi:hypothetical protein